MCHLTWRVARSTKSEIWPLFFIRTLQLHIHKGCEQDSVGKRPIRVPGDRHSIDMISATMASFFSA